MQSLNAIVVDDEQIISDSLSGMLRLTGIFELVTNFYSIAEVKKEMLQRDYHYIFTDLKMADDDVKGFIAFARKTWPEIIIIVISSLMDTGQAKEIFTAGANGYISKFSSSEDLKNAIKKTGSGQRYVSPDMTERLVTASIALDQNGLTKKELEILRCVANGESIIETAANLNLSRHTVITHRRNIMEKLKLHSAAEMVKYAFENKLC